MPPVLAYFTHHINPYLIRFSNGFGIKYYGLAYALGFVIAGVLLYQYWKRGRSPLNPDGQSDLLLYAMIGTLVGGRLGYFVFYSPHTFIDDPLAIFRVWDGGMASHGGFIGVLIGTWLAARKHKLPFLTADDLMVTLAPPGLFLGRIANFINGELWGKVTTVPWAFYFPEAVDADGTCGHGIPRNSTRPRWKVCCS